MAKSNVKRFFSFFFKRVYEIYSKSIIKKLKNKLLNQNKIVTNVLLTIYFLRV